MLSMRIGEKSASARVTQLMGCNLTVAAERGCLPTNGDSPVDYLTRMDLERRLQQDECECPNAGCRQPPFRLDETAASI